MDDVKKLQCMNARCGAAETGREWRKGWGLRSGALATLCSKCGTAFEQSIFCDIYHAKESGWRQCASCRKPLHCGCIVSKASVSLLDHGGVLCIGCSKNLEVFPVVQDVLPQSSGRVVDLTDESLNVEKLNKVVVSVSGSARELEPPLPDGDIAKKVEVSGLEKQIDVNAQKVSLDDPENGSFCLTVRNPTYAAAYLSQKEDSKDVSTGKIMLRSLNQAHESVGLEVRDENKGLSKFQSLRKVQNLLPVFPKTSSTGASEASKNFLPNVRVARPPGDGRGRSQMLPRYWPRITDQELRQISGDSNTTIVPLFEKVLSASDAGRIGRLVLPKACAEAYFPPISQPEGLPLRVQDINGKEWHFQFRFWPNNNSRMYVLEGVTPCIQSLQLQAGDTVTFSRIDPEGKLVMGFRKANIPQDSQISMTANETIFSALGSNNNALRSEKGAEDPNISCLSNYFSLSDVEMSWSKIDNYGIRSNDTFTLQPSLLSEMKGSRSVGTKSKRLHMDSEEALELKITWEEVQDLLRPSPSSKPSIIVIEDHEFEEYDEPPVFAKHTIFTESLAGGQDQWIQCDECLKWRQLPVDVLPPPRWACSDNKWNPKRSSCSSPDELSLGELQHLLQQDAEFRRQKMSSSSKLNPLEQESSVLDAGNPSLPSTAATTKHPRHRPGCTCIVCIQPPSGKGPKHEPSCVCNVCLTVKRRFKTLMMRKKKRQSELEEAEVGQRKLQCGQQKEEDEDSSGGGGTRSWTMLGEAPLDLNSEPGFLDEGLHLRAGLSGSRTGSMISLVQVASRPLETYLKQNGLASLALEQSSTATEIKATTSMEDE